MTLEAIDAATGEVVTLLTEADARRLTERIRLTAMNAREAIEKLHMLVDEARAGRAHEALGYPSWQAYLADVFGDQPLRLPRDQRIEVVQMLANEDMSNRAIAAVLGVNEWTVRDDQKQVRGLPAPAPSTASILGGEAETPAAQTPVTVPVERPAGPAVDVAEPGVSNNAAASRTVTGLDGKTYTRKPAEPRRIALAPQAQKAAEDMFSAVEKVAGMFADDRFPQNREQVATLTRSYLLRTVEVCQNLLDQLDRQTHRSQP